MIRHPDGVVDAVQAVRAGQAGLGARTTARRTFVTDFTARTGRRARERRNGRGVVVRFHLHQRMHQPIVVRVLALSIRVDTLRGGSG